MQILFHERKIKIYWNRGWAIIIRNNELTKETVDAIVNSTREDLKYIEGTSFEIWQAGGNIIKNELKSYIKEHGKLSTGCAMVTSAGNLPWKAVIHAVGPKFNEAATDHTLEDTLMQRTVTSVLEQVIKNNYKSVSIPAISLRISNFPTKEFAKNWTKAIMKFINDHEQEMKNRKLILCNLDDDITNELLETVPNILNSPIKANDQEE